LAEPDHPVARLEWAFARVVAETALGRIAAAEAERARYAAIERALPATALWWSDPVKAVLPLALYEISARLAWARGDRAGALALWQQAVAAQDRLTPGEIPPWPWFHSTRESLGAAFFKLGRFADAESVFREDLRRFRGNPRSLYGLSQALQWLGKPEAADLDRQFREAWADADVGLTMDDL
jgi:tetratricopeptide (TPR) repeat protein